jgi:N-acyl homoserine lactone hydrolase
MNGSAKSETPSTVNRMTVLNGGEAHVTDISQWSPNVNVGQPFVFSNNAYLIQHGDDYLLWDTGLDDEMIKIPGGKVVAHDVRGIVSKTLDEQLQEVGVKPEQITHIAFSHAHFDHVGNSRYFSSAVWHVQQTEYDAMFGPDYQQFGFIPELYECMRNNRLNIVGDRYDVFGDGSVIVYSTPGHTPGHQSLLVRLRHYGPVMLSGDVAHFHNNFCCRRVPLFNFDKPRSIRSMDLVDEIVKAEGAQLWINHDNEQNATIPHAPEWID